MRTTYRPARCARRATSPTTARHDDSVVWARDFVAEPTRSVEHARHQFMVGDLLAQIEAGAR